MYTIQINKLYLEVILVKINDVESLVLLFIYFKSFNLLQLLGNLYYQVWRRKDLTSALTLTLTLTVTSDKLEGARFIKEGPWSFGELYIEDVSVNPAWLPT